MAALDTIRRWAWRCVYGDGVIAAVAFVPQAPLLIPALTGGSSPELDELRTACRGAINDVAPGRQVVVVGSGSANTAYASNARGTLAGHGVDLEVGLGSDASGPIELSLELTIGAWLVRDALGANSGVIGYSVDADDPDLPVELATDERDIGLVVLGDGSACRTLKAPRYLQDRAADYDGQIASALRGGRGHLLRRELHDEEVLAQLHIAGVPVWDAVSRLVEAQSWDAELRYDAAPFGVGYFVAVWTRRG